MPIFLSKYLLFPEGLATEKENHFNFPGCKWLMLLIVEPYQNCSVNFTYTAWNSYEWLRTKFLYEKPNSHYSIFSLKVPGKWKEKLWTTNFFRVPPELSLHKILSTPSSTMLHLCFEVILTNWLHTEIILHVSLTIID